MTTALRSVTVAGAVAALVGVAAPAQADYQVVGTVSGKTFLGASGNGGVFKAYRITVDGRTFCVRSSQVSTYDPLDASQFSRVFRGPQGNRVATGAQGINNGEPARAQVNTSASPSTCGGYKLAYLVYLSE